MSSCVTWGEVAETAKSVLAAFGLLSVVFVIVFGLVMALSNPTDQ